jgi:GT2 family glycosyltransferase/SAM-dependent methyltransferase/glycosyltransferase involved in cell wall biosynthesis
MSLERRAGAPRLIEWTGERCVPWAPDVQVVYEHLHRYLWAEKLVAGKRVLDVGSGEGFGASILAENAAEVVGIDIDERTVEHARLNWSTSRISFSLGSALDLSAFDEDSFDAVVAFEIIEHVSDQEQMLREVARVLKGDGLLIASTPDRRLYSEASGQVNPFHTRELTYEEFSALLQTKFANVGLWGQRSITGSHLGALDRSDSAAPSRAEFFIERAGEEWRIAGEPAALYLVAVASDGALPEIPASSTLGDCGLELVRAKAQEGAEVAAGLIAERDEAFERESHAREMIEAERADHDADVAAHDVELKRLDAELVERDEYLHHRHSEIVGLRARLRDVEAAVADARSQLEDAQRFTRRVESSVTWQVFQGVRGRVFASVGERSLSVRALRLFLRLGGRLMKRRHSTPEAPREVASPQAGGEPINLPTFERPRVSLIIPLHAGAGLTRRCLETIRDNTDQIAYEVILVDDTADAETKSLLDLVTGARILDNEENLGYLRSVNRAAAVTGGEWLVLCNNDIEVSPGWLTAMLACATSRERVGVVAPKFVSPDGRLSEAGGIIWSDATGVNYGRGDDPTRYQYEYTREVDYGSAAALMVRAELWRDVGGFDARFVPMYYEDVDLCFEARKRGWGVFYEPSAVVTHVEGATAGTDPQAGHKRHQEINRGKFLAKWRPQLDAEHLRPSDRSVRTAANRHRGPNVLVVDFRVPMWDRDAGSLRMFEIVRSLLRRGYGVTLAPDNFARFEPYTRVLQRLGVEVIYGESDPRIVLADIGSKLVAAILSRPHPASRWLDSVRESAPSAVAIYDTVDLHWVRESRRFALGDADSSPGNRVIPALGPKAAALFELELAMVRASDVTVAVTEAERAQILSQVPDARVTIIPTIHEVAKHVPRAAGRRDLLFLGGFEHPPNIDAAIYLVREIMPRVWRHRADVSVTIVGGSAPREVEELAASRVDIRGWVADLHPLVDTARAMVVPVRFGAGIKGKITQGLAAGLPVVTTTVGAEGLEGEDGQSMLVGDDPEALAERVLQVLEDDELWQSLSVAGQELVAARCSLDLLDERLSETLAGNRSEPRDSMGTGRIAAGETGSPRLSEAHLKLPG